MKVRHRYKSFIPGLMGVDAVTIYPWIFYKGVPTQERIEHEMVHVGQIRRYGWLSFYASYLLYYFAGLIRFKNHDTAYRTIPYEIEAYGRR